MVAGNQNVLTAKKVVINREGETFDLTGGDRAGAYSNFLPLSATTLIWI